VDISKATGMLYVPENLEAFFRAKVPPLAMAVIRDEEIPYGDLERLQSRCGQELIICPSKPKGSTVILLPINGAPSTHPERFRRALKQCCGVELILIHSSPADIQSTTRKELSAAIGNVAPETAC